MRAAVVTKDHKVSIEDKKLRALKPGAILSKLIEPIFVPLWPSRGSFFMILKLKPFFSDNDITSIFNDNNFSPF